METAYRHKDSLVTIIIPCYNSEKFIHNTVKSLTAQTHSNVQVLCIDDGSKDSTKSIIEAIGEEESRVEVRSKENAGIESALKYGLQFIKGDYTFLIGHDDTLSSDTIEKALDAFQADAEMDAVRPDLEFVYEDETPAFVMADRRILSGKEAFLETIGGWSIHTFCLWRTNIFKKIKDVDTNGNFNFDELATRYLYLNCRKVGYCTGVYLYLQHAQSVSKKKSIRHIEVLLTDMLIRDLIKSQGLYKDVAAKFEHYAALNLIGVASMFHSLANLTKQQKKSGVDYLRRGYKALDKRLVLPYLGGSKPTMWKLILNSFTSFMIYTKVKYISNKSNVGHHS